MQDYLKSNKCYFKIFYIFTYSFSIHSYLKITICHYFAFKYLQFVMRNFINCLFISNLNFVKNHYLNSLTNFMTVCEFHLFQLINPLKKLLAKLYKFI